VISPSIPARPPRSQSLLVAVLRIRGRETGRDRVGRTETQLLGFELGWRWFSRPYDRPPQAERGRGATWGSAASSPVGHAKEITIDGTDPDGPACLRDLMIVQDESPRHRFGRQREAAATPSGARLAVTDRPGLVLAKIERARGFVGQADLVT
jgi:hypothetical protein